MRPPHPLSAPDVANNVRANVRVPSLKTQGVAPVYNRSAAEVNYIACGFVVATETGLDSGTRNTVARHESRFRRSTPVCVLLPGSIETVREPSPGPWRPPGEPFSTIAASVHCPQFGHASIGAVSTSATTLGGSPVPQIRRNGCSPCSKGSVRIAASTPPSRRVDARNATHANPLVE